MAECIHGLDVPLCDICYPKAVPEKPRVTRQAAAPRARAAGPTTSRKSLNVGEQRVYHVTHLRNLPGIIAEGLQSADARPEVDVSSDLTRELRITAVVATSSVAEHVPFYLAPDASRWEELRAGAADETRWSDAARRATPSDFVFLVSTLARLGDDLVIADGDAAATLSRFATSDGIPRAVERLHADEDARRAAEALVPGSVPFAAVQLIGVANDPVRERVRELVSAASGVAPKVVVYPPWFQQA